MAVGPVVLSGGVGFFGVSSAGARWLRSFVFGLSGVISRACLVFGGFCRWSLVVTFLGHGCRLFGLFGLSLAFLVFVLGWWLLTLVFLFFIFNKPSPSYSHFIRSTSLT